MWTFGMLLLRLLYRPRPRKAIDPRASLHREVVEDEFEFEDD